MEFHQLQSFVAVAEEGHLTRAADRLCISQPAVSAHIKALEEELGVRLFARTPKGMDLTETGRQVLEQARKTLEAAEQLRLRARALARDVAGTVRLGLNADPEFLRAPALMADLAGCHPGLRFEFSQGQSVTICRDVLRRDLDAGFVYGPVRHPELAIQDLCTQKLVVVGPPQWRDRLERADWDELARLPWVWVPEECPFHALADAEFSKRGLEPVRQLQADDETLLRSLVTAGAGLSLLSEVEAMAAERKGTVTLWPGGDMRLPLRFVHLEARTADPLVQVTLEGVRRAWATGEEAVPADAEPSPRVLPGLAG